MKILKQPEEMKKFDKIPLLIFFITFIVASVFSQIDVDEHHDGILLKPAIDVAQGKQLFRDTFTQYGAMTTILQVTFLKIFGNYLLVLKLSAAFFYAITAIILYASWSKFLSKNLSIVAWIVWLLLAPYYVVTFIPWSSVYALFFLSIVLYILILYCKNLYWENIVISKSQLFLLGVMSSLTFWSRQSVGIFLLLALLIFFVILTFFKKISPKKLFTNINIVLLGFFCVSAIFLLWLYLTKSLQDWWLQSIVLPFKFGGEFSGAYNYFGIRSLFVIYYRVAIDSYFFWALIPITVLFFFIKSLYQLHSNYASQIRTIQVLAASLICLASWLQYYPSADLRHTYWAASPMVGFYLYGLIELFKGWELKFVTIRTVIIFITFSSLILILNSRISSAIGKVDASRHYVTFDSPKVLRGMRVEKAEKDYYLEVSNKVNDYLKKNPAKNFIVLGPDALYLTFVNRSTNIHPLFINRGTTFASIYPDYEMLLNNYIRNDRPLILIENSVLARREIPIPTGYILLQNWPSHSTLLVAPND